ncbi:MAG: acetyl-CoA decarbonylase/synthase complex subunit gamma [Promethearchaeota archaeon]
MPWKRPTPLEVYKYLDKSNCGKCGYQTCMAFTSDLLERKVKLQDCAHLMEDPKQAKNREKLAQLIKPPQMAVEFGTGPRKAVIGGEEVLYRHELTFFNPTAIAIEVHDQLDDFEEVVKYLDGFCITRIGEELKLDAIAVRCVSGDPDAFAEKVLAAAELTELPLILCSWNVDALRTAALAIPDKKPLLYAATKDNWKEVGEIAAEHGLPVVCFSTDVDELLSVAASLRSMGVQEICLDPGTTYGPGLTTQTFDKVYKLRLAAIREGLAEAGYPVIGVPATVWLNADDEEKWQTHYKEAIMGVILQSIDASMVIMRSGRNPDERWVLLAMMTFRQNIFTDPRVYPSVDPGLVEIGTPGPDSPIFVTSNYRMTKIPVEDDIKSAGIDGYLLVVDSGGIAVEAAVVGGQFTNGQIAEAIQETKVFEKVNHRIVIIPGHAARYSGALEDDANCAVLVGPRDSSGIPKMMKERWKPEEIMEEFNSR